MKKILISIFMLFALFALASCNESYTPLDYKEIGDVGNFQNYSQLKEYLDTFYDDTSAYRNEYYMDAAVGAMTTTVAATTQGTGEEKSFSETNNQVEGVYESDRILTDGYYIYVLSNNQFVIVNAEDLSISDTFSYSNDDTYYGYTYGMYKYENFIVLLTNEYHYDQSLDKTGTGVYDFYYVRYTFGTRVTVLDITDKTDIAISKELYFEGSSLTESRMIDGYCYLVMNNYAASYGYTDDTYIPEYYDSSVSDEIIKLPAGNIYYMPNDYSSFGYLMLVSFAVSTDEAADVNAYLGSSYQIFMSQNNLYTIVYRYWYDEVTFFYNYQTMIIRYAIEDHKLVYKAVGSVDGSPLNQFSMDEYDGYFRIATTGYEYTEVTRWIDYDPSTIDDTVSSDEVPVTTVPVTTVPVTTTAPATTIPDTSDVTEDTNTGSWSTIEYTWKITNKVTIFDATSDGIIEPVSEIDDLGKPNERIYAVRFSGDYGYVVTFVNTDPLYKLDLSDPENPEIIGEMFEEGVSDYLHEIGDNLLLGVGRQAAMSEWGFTYFTGVKVSLYDTSGNDPISLETYFVEGDYSYSPVTYDHKAFVSYEPDGEDFMYVAIPVYEYNESFYRSLQSVYVFKVFYSGDLQYLTKLTHMEDPQSEYYYYYYDSIERTVMIENMIYTVSYSKIQQYDMSSDFAFVAKTEFEQE